MFEIINTVRHKDVHPRVIMALVASVALLVGCTRVHYGIFLNTLDQDFALEVRQLQSDGQFHNPENYKLPAGGKIRAVCLIAEVTARDSSGRVLFQQVLPALRTEIDKYQNPAERKIFYMVTADGAYPIPRDWRENWKEHQKEIIAGFDVNAARQRLLKERELRK